MRRSIGGAALFAAALMAVAPDAALAQANFTNEVPCGPTVPERLARIGVDRANIAEYLTEENWSHGNNTDTFLGWTVWMRMKTCDGQVVMSLSPSCVIDTVYTTRQCRIDGVYHSG